ncbi:TlpA family protein disulfide reductase [bacterium]|nr:TlpA family protein disulfide reductase [bacterium]
MTGSSGIGRGSTGLRALAAAFMAVILAWSPVPGQDKFPREELETLDGAATRLAPADSARLTVLDFWALWCAPCQQAIPELRGLAERMQGRPVRFRFIDCDNTRSRSKVRSFSLSKGIAAEVLLDPSQKLMRYYGIAALPHLVVLDSAGNVVDREAGYMLGDHIKLEKKLLELLGQ